MIAVEKNGIRYYQFQLLSGFSELFHGVFCRHGGVSTGVHDSLNVGFGLGDAEKKVRENRRLIAGCFHNVRLVFTRQVHGTEVLTVSETAVDGRIPVAGQSPEADALVSDLIDTGLGIQTADCQAVMIYDPVRRVAANIHSGWRGSVANVIGRTVSVMMQKFGCRPADMTAGIGPSLGPCCAEFVHYKKEIPKDFWEYKDENDMFDFWAVSADQLIQAGIGADRIETAGLCTRCRPDLFFSYRGEGRTGRFAAVIGVHKK